MKDVIACSIFASAVIAAIVTIRLGRNYKNTGMLPPDPFFPFVFGSTFALLTWSYPWN